MNKLDAAIERYRSMNHSLMTERARLDYRTLAGALEEIRHFHEAVTASFDNIHKRIDVEIADKQPEPVEPPAFQPWDCVRAKPGSHLEQYTGDAELVLGHRDPDGDWKVFDPDDAGERGVLYCQDDEIVFVRRLKPRAQEPQPVFKRGDIVRNIFDIEEYPYEVMQDTNGPRVQLRDCKTGQPRAFAADDLRKVDKPAPFQVGDWAEEFPTGNKVQILKVFSTYSTVEDNSGRRYNRANGHLKKIATPTPRFTFGDRVLYDDGDFVFRFVCDDGEGMAYIYDDEDKCVRNVSTSALTPLDTAAD